MPRSPTGRRPGRPRATPEQLEHRMTRRAWAARTEHAALRALARKHPAEYMAIREQVRAADPEPVRPRPGGGL